MKHPSRAERRRRAREGTPSPAAAAPVAAKPASPPPPARPAVRSPQRSRRLPAWAWWAVGVALVLVIVAVAWWALSPRSAAQIVPKIDGDHIASEGNAHVKIGTPIEYQAHPPASGSHYPTPAPRGVYPEGIPEGFWVHSLEHGYIVLAYRPPVSPEQIQRFQQMVQSFPNSKYGYAKLVVVPYKEMDHPYAVLAWTWRLWLDQLDRNKVLGFYLAHVDRGPEDIP